ncbi:hypothetical protein [Xanthomonas oryzae]|uniref:hypothetical protein n=1 Tax=Xanthomonas oryzae TaxID=347 RepID=UPI000949FCE4|nr:hypothetical protein [Xanthomonas oryzae]UXW32291.1 hypothetical protein IXO644_006085 [Xanthomonas oryzae pv. oryzae]UZF10068.1 hypothetical protein IXO645_006100 [Xanthomonas oryzae pv. oryzae]
MTQKKKATSASTTNQIKGSVVKVVVSDDQGSWVQPNKDAIFFIDEDAFFPEIKFEITTQQPPPYTLTWLISWDAKVSGLAVSKARGSLKKEFSAKGQATLTEKTWKADLGQVLGGKLTVMIKAGTETFKRSVLIKGKNPSKEKVENYLATLNDVVGFDVIVEQESKFKNFIDFDDEPIVAFDNGYGMTQLTSPAPTYTQAWSWKENINGGSKLYQNKQKEAKGYLGAQNRTYTNDQLKLETWSRWNGGSYHVWDEKSNSWVRNGDIACDSKTGNIGWDMTRDVNSGKTEDELHKRDKDEYKKPPTSKDRKWKYTGVCYADHVESN